MSFLSAFPFMRIIVPFILGIITAIYLECQANVWLVVLCLVFALILLETFWLNISAIYRYRFFAGILFAMLFFFLGITLVKLNHQGFFHDHFSHRPNADLYYGEVSDAPVEKKKSWKVIVEVLHVRDAKKWEPVRGKLLCYIRKSETYVPKPGDRILFSPEVKTIEPAKNPGQFDYKQYLYYHNIYQQAYLSPENVQLVKREGNALKNFAYDLRQQLITSFKKNGLDNNELAVAGALLFGVTDQLDPGLIRAYAGTGALHVLSVSGLHVGIIYGFLQMVLSFLYKRRNGKIITGIIILLFIWFYALLTGLTPSVLRSSTMFTFIVVGQVFSRQSSMYNSIAASAFVLLCFNPFLIMEVGFQLSYLAVLGIVVLYPLVFNQLKVSNKILRQVWMVTAVSIAAQIATLPLGLLYFHQFPNYFIFSNLLVIPISGIILYTGIMAAFFYTVPGIQYFFVKLLEWMIITMNEIVSFIERLPYALLEGISITIFESCLLYALILLGWTWYRSSDPRFIKYICLVTLIICALQLGENAVLHRQQKLVVYDVPHHTAIDLVFGKQHVFISDSLLYHNPDQMLFCVKHHWDDLNLNKPEVIYTDDLTNRQAGFARIKKNLVFFHDLSLQVVNENYNFRTDTLKATQLILLSHNPKINLTKLPKNLDHALVIADGSNEKFRLKKWRKQAAERKIRFYATSQSGAYIKEFE